MVDCRSLAINILLICREGKSRHGYQPEIDFPGITVIYVQTFMDFFTPSMYCPLNGILVDMPTYLRSTEEEKRLITVLVGIFPSLRLKFHEPTGEIRMLPFGTSYPANLSLPVFMRQHCSTFMPRKIRTSERVQLNLAVLLNRSFPLQKAYETKSVTTNISSDGCYLISFEPWIVGERGWLMLQGLEDTTPIPVQVCWINLWNQNHSLPGMGMRFLELTAQQISELIRLGAKKLISETKCLAE